jgi:hypothetical protein
MPENVFYCDVCGAPMELEKKFQTKKRGRKKMVYRIRRFKCTACEFRKTIFADGEIDEKFIPEQGVKKMDRIYKQEEKNRES